ncbi:MAG: hypothetical protein AB2L12_04585 [Smithellaceae bacterium]
MNKQRIGILIASGIGMFGTFMPWAKTINSTVDGTNKDGWISFGLFLIIFLISLIKDRSQSLKGGLLYAALVPSVIAVVLGIFEIIEIKNSMLAKYYTFLGGVSIGFGLVLIIVAGIAVPIIAFTLKDNH